MSLRLLFLGLLLVPWTVRAGGDDLKKALQLSAEMKYPQALRLVDKVLRSASSDPAQLRSAYEIRGQSLAAMGKSRKAVQAFRRLLALDPSYRLSESVSPKIQPPFEKALKQSVRQGAIRLFHTPPLAGKSLAGTSLTARLEANPFKLVRTVRLVYHAPGGKPRKAARPVKRPGEFTFKLPSELQAEEIHYYFEALNRFKGALVRAGSPDEPYRLSILPIPAEPAAVAAAPEVEMGLDLFDEGDDPGSPAAPSVVRKPRDGAGLSDQPAVIADGKIDLADSEGPDAEEQEKEEDLSAPAWYETWWFWTGVGVLAAGGLAAGVAVGLSGAGGGPIEYDVVLR